MKRHAWQVIVGIVLVGGLIFLLWQGDAVEDTFVPETTAADVPDVELLGTTMNSFGEGGILEYELNAERIAYTRDSGLYEIDHPAIAHHMETEIPWRLQSNYGSMLTKSPGGKDIAHPQINLRGGVVLSGPDGSFRTESLAYNPQAQQVSTSAEVSVKYQGSSVISQGLVVDLAAGTYELNIAADANTQTVIEVDLGEAQPE